MNKFYKWFSILYYKNSIKNPKQLIKNLKYINSINYNDIKNNEVSISKNNFKDIKKAFKKMILSYPEGLEIISHFLNADLKYIVKNIDIENIEKDSPILICLVKNDLKKIKEMYNHHKKIGIKNFVFIDNNSTDGTIEFLKEKEDVDLISSNIKYCTLAREAWINRILYHYGYGHWFLVVDSDEMYNYIDSENIKIDEHINRLLKNNIRRELSFMLDMYSKGEIFKNVDNFVDKYSYFDTNTYKLEENKRFIKISGGPRKRNFQENSKQKEFMLGKYPLFLFEKGDIQSNSHFTFPFYKNINLKCTSILMHYKFLGDDIEKYKIRIKEKNYYNGSSDYKVYINNYEKNKDMTFYYKDSTKYESSLSLRKIDILKEI